MEKLKQKLDITNFDGVIFDLDGTIADSMWIWEEIDKRFFAKRQIEMPNDYVEKINSMTFDQTAIYTKQTFGLAESTDEIKKEWFDMAKDAYAKEIPLKKGALHFLNLLKSHNIKIGLATAANEELTNAFLTNHNIENYFEMVAYLSKEDESKSQPYIYQRVAKSLNVEPKKCLVFEDINSAICGANKGGFFTVGVFDKYAEYEMDSIKQNAKFFVYSFDELL